MPDIHIGKEIRQRLDEYGMTPKAFAARMGMTTANAYDLFKRPSIPIEQLLQVGKVLQFDFLALYQQKQSPNGHILHEPPPVYNAKGFQEEFVSMVKYVHKITEQFLKENKNLPQ